MPDALPLIRDILLNYTFSKSFLMPEDEGKNLAILILAIVHFAIFLFFGGKKSWIALEASLCSFSRVKTEG